MRTIRRRFPGEQGSALLISLMMIFIMTILGLALFDLGVIESRLTAADEADARALEIANAALERAYRIETNFVINNDTLVDGGLDNTSNDIYNPLTVSNTAFLGGGTYAIEGMNVTQPTANGVPFGQPCMVVGGLCKDLTLVRARGRLLATGDSPSATYGRVRAIQVLLRAESLSPFAYAVTAETQGPNQIRGLIAGSVNFLRCPSSDGFIATCNPFGFDSSSFGQRNHYNDLSGDPTSLIRITPLQNVCPAGSTCATRMFSMGATLKVAAPTTSPAVVTAASLGESTNPGPYTHGVGNTFVGKGTLDNVFVADGCSTATCSDNFTLTGGAAVNVNDSNLKKPYPRQPPRSFPLLTDPVQVGAIQYNHYACGMGGLPACGGGANDHFFGPPTSGSQVVAMDAATTANGPCDITVSPFICTGNLGAALSGGDLGNTPAFVHDFTYVNAVGSTRNGRLCWTGPSGTAPAVRTLFFANDAALALPAVTVTQVALLAGTNCPAANIATPGAPVLLWFNANLQLLEPSGTPSCTVGSPARCIQYRGAAILLVGGTVAINVILQNLCSVGGQCVAQKFPDNDFLAVLSTGNMSIGVNQNGLDRVMGLFYTAGQFRSAGQSGSGSRVVIIGTVAARTFCFASPGSISCGGGGSDETRFFQAGLTAFPDELLPGRNRWAIVPLQKFWRECAPVAVTPNYTFGTGMCLY